MRSPAPDRRELLAAGGAAALAFATRARAQDAEPAPPRLRTITYNVLACAGFDGEGRDSPAVRRVAPQIPARIALELALYEPDVVTFQESPREPVVADIARRLGMEHAYFPGGFPGSVLSRFPIAASENCPLAEGPRPPDLFTRHWGKALLRAPFGDLTLYTAHLYPGGEEGRDRRLREIPLILEAMRADLEAGRPVILQGDLNHGPDTPEYERWVAAGLRDAFVAEGSGPPETFSSTDPRWRIDYVWTHGDLPPLKGCRVLYEGAFRTYADDPRPVALSDHLPVLAELGG